MQQRGLKGDFDLDLFLKYASEFSDGLLMRQTDIENAMAEIQAQRRFLDIQYKRIEKLKNKVIITNGDCVITAYNPSRRCVSKFRRTMR
jgi:hypothetical protein